MKAIDFNALMGITLNDVAAANVSTGGGKIDRTPTTHDLRIYKTGAVYPSESLIAAFNLEYNVKDAEDKGLGFDICEAHTMPQFPKELPNCVLIAAVAKSETSVDLFSKCTWDGDGYPVKSVKTQGTKALDVLELICRVYGTTIDALMPKATDFIELDIVHQVQIPSPSGVYLMPKVVARGDKKGQLKYERRTNITVTPLSLVTEVKAEAVAPVAAAEVLEAQVAPVMATPNPVAEYPMTPEQSFATKPVATPQAVNIGQAQADMANNPVASAPSNPLAAMVAASGIPANNVVIASVPASQPMNQETADAIATAAANAIPELPSDAAPAATPSNNPLLGLV